MAPAMVARNSGLMDRERTEQLARSSQLDYFRFIKRGRVGWYAGTQPK